MARSDEIASLLAEKIRGQDWPPLGLLPGIRALAEEYAASPAIITKALRILSHRGFINQARTKGRYRVLSGRDAPDVPARVEAGEPKVLWIAKRITEEAFADGFPGSTLPSRKELKHRFRCGFDTLGRALELLEQRGILERQGRNYAIRHGAPRRKRSARLWLAGHPEMVRPYLREFSVIMGAIEKEIHALELGPLELFMTPSPEKAEPPGAEEVSGFISWLELRKDKWKWWEYFRSQTDSAIPVSLINLAEVLFDNPVHVRKSGIRSLSPDNLQAGRDTAHLLADLGHKSIAFISHAHFQDPAVYDYRRDMPLWARNRFLGLGELFPLSGGSRRLRFFDGSTLPAVDSSAPLDAAWESVRSAWRGLTQAKVRSSLMQHGLNPAFDLISSCRLARRLEPLFEEALAFRDVTAWVCINDEVAAHAAAFLAARGMDAPGHLSLTSFDNSPLAYTLGLTSWDPNLTGLGHLTVRSLTHPHLVPKDANGRSWVKGRIIVRRSTGRARKI